MTRDTWLLIAGICGGLLPGGLLALLFHMRAANAEARLADARDRLRLHARADLRAAVLWYDEHKDLPGRHPFPDAGELRAWVARRYEEREAEE